MRRKKDALCIKWLAGCVMPLHTPRLWLGVKPVARLVSQPLLPPSGLTEEVQGQDTKELWMSSDR